MSAWRGGDVQPDCCGDAAAMLRSIDPIRQTAA